MNQKEMNNLYLIVILLLIITFAVPLSFEKQVTQENVQEEIREREELPNLPLFEEQTTFSGDCLLEGGELLNPTLVSCPETKKSITLSDEVNKNYICCI